MDYYKTYWKQLGGIKVSEVFNVLPVCLQMQLRVDKYWNAIEQVLLTKLKKKLNN